MHSNKTPKNCDICGADAILRYGHVLGDYYWIMCSAGCLESSLCDSAEEAIAEWYDTQEILKSIIIP